MDRWVGKTAVVTGSGSGIGAAIALALANAGLNVVGLDVKQKPISDDLMKMLAGPGTLNPRQCDMSCPTAVEEAFCWVRNTFGGTDALVNNAGIVYHGSITEVGPNPLTVEELMLQIDVDIKSVVLCARSAARCMHQRAFPGHIVNISSIAGHQVPSLPIFNVYSAAKHAVTATTLALHNEFSSFEAKIKTTNLSPGLVMTNMANFEKMPHLKEIVEKGPALQPEDIAAAVLYVLGTPPHVNIDELTITPLGEKRL